MICLICTIIISQNQTKHNYKSIQRKEDVHGGTVYQKIARSIEKYGCVEPIIWNEKTGNVIGGHQRLKVLAATGAVEVDVSVGSSHSGRRGDGR